MVAIGLSKQKVPDADSKAIQQISFTTDLNRAENTTIFFIIFKKQKKRRPQKEV